MTTWQPVTIESRLREGIDPSEIREAEQAMDAGADMIALLRAALEQAIDDFGEGHCVCEATKQMCIEAAGVERKVDKS